MRLTNVKAINFRCFPEFDIAPGPNLNIISGDNASGKTSILEAIYLLGRGQSFRGATLGPQVLKGEKRLVVSGRTQSEDGQRRRIGMVRARKGGLAYKLDNETKTKRFDLVSTLPLQLVDPNLHRLLELGPKYRRSFLDWGVFHVEHRFFSAWRQYRRALKQRNRALRSNATVQAIQAWNPELIRTSSIIDETRKHYVQQLAVMLPESILRLLGNDAPEITYYAGWGMGGSYADCLDASLETDRKMGYTQIGPHRSDVRVRVAGEQARAHVSRGQQKLLVTAMLLAQARLMFEVTGTRPVLLVDDLVAELGPVYLRTLLDEIQHLNAQCFITVLDQQLVSPVLQDGSMFHVEHGRVLME